MISVEHVSKRYGMKTVVDDVSLTVPKGGITSFIGPNGAGKSTLLSMMSRLMACDAGTITVDGLDVSSCDSRELARALAILKQNNEIRVRLTIRDLVGFGRFPYSQGRLTEHDRQLIDDAIEYMALGDLQHRFLDQLSGGQRQRAFIAMVLCQDTDYVLLDEPLNNLDMKYSLQVMQLLRQMVIDFGKTIVLVIHDINFASCHSDWIVALKDGKIAQQGRADQVINTGPLYDVYDLEIPIHLLDGQRIGVYFS